MDKAIAFFESFNTALEAAYNKYFEIAEKDLLKGLKEDCGLLERYLSEESEKWEETNLSELEGISPLQFINQINDFSTMIDMFFKGASICDDKLPVVFLNKLQTFGEESIDKLLELSRKSITSNSDEDDFFTAMLAIKILGIWRVGRSTIPLIELLYSDVIESEILFENVKEALVMIGKPAVISLIQTIENKGLESEAGEYLLIALSEIGEKNKSDVIYKCLKNSFINMPNKTIGAICLGYYGDGRAIPALRGYIERNKNVDDELFYEIISAIKALGGNCDDLSR